MKLTDAAVTKIVRSVKEEGKSDHIEWDSELHGFGLRVRNGKRSWIFQYNIGKQTYRVRLGDLDCGEARTKAEACRGDAARAKLGLGDHPAAVRDKKKAEERTPRGQKLAALVARYLEARIGTMKPRSYAETKRHLEQHWKPLHGSPVQNIVRADVAARVREIAKASGPVAANRARASLSAMFVWAIGEGECDFNPVAGSNKQEENGPRERSLSDTEAAAVWLKAPENNYGRIVRLILLTGCRRDEIGALRWSEIDHKARTITLPADRTKNGQPHVVPLSDSALAVLKACEQQDGRDLVFGRGQGGYSGWSKSKAALDDDAKLKEPWTLHDLRRTVRTGMGKLGVAPHIAETVLNHLPPKLIRTYDRNTYAAEKKAALDLWASHLMIAVAKATGANVTTLRKA